MENKLYTITQVMDVMEYGQIAILVDSNSKKPFVGTGTSIYYDEHDNGALKFLHSGNDVVVCKGDHMTINNWMIVDDNRR